MTSLIENLQRHLERGGIGDYTLVALDIAIVAILIYLVILFAKGTRASKIIIGLVILGAVFLIGKLLALETLSWLLRNVSLLILVTIPVVFQPELRRALEKLGRTRIVSKEFLVSNRDVAKLANCIAETSQILQDNKVGGIIVLKRKTGLDDAIETGEKIDATISTKLLLNIFFPNSPLHDGAVILEGNRIAAASCTLPLSDDEQSYRFGTRHRAALGVTESTDAIAIVVSEQNGAISLAVNSSIERLTNSETLREKLVELLSIAS